MSRPPATYDLPHGTSLSQQATAQLHSRFGSLCEELRTRIKGSVSIRGELEFEQSVKLFNNAAPLGAWLVAFPRDVLDVSIIVRFCFEHGVSPSVKSGGFATAGWAIQGDLVVDTRRMDDVQLLLPDRSHPASTSGPPPNAYNATPAQSIAGAQSNGTNGPAKNDEISMSAGSTGLAMTFSTPSVSGTDARTLEAQYEPGAQPIQEQLTASKPVPPPFVRQPSRTRKADEAFMEEDSTTPEGTDGSSSRRRVIADGSAQKPLAATPSSLEPKSSSSNGQLQPTALALEATGHFRIGESGADADDKSGGPGSTDSGGSGRRSERGDWPDETNPLSREGSGEARGELSGESAEDRSARARQPSNYGKHGKPWAERTLDERAESSESPSGSSSLATGQSSGMESASNDQLPDGKVDGRTRSSSSIPTASSSSLRSEETLQNGATDASLSFNPPFEHERWQRHHQPSVPSGFSSSPASGQGVKLPATGGFIWRGGDEGSSTTVLPWDADTFADSAAVSLPNLGSHLPGGLPRMSVAGTDGFARRPDADGSLLSAAMLPSDPEGQARFWGADGLAAAASLSAGPPMPQTWPPSESSHHPGLFANSAPGVAFPMGLEARKTATLPAGAYPDRFALVSFGPGAGIRGLDAFTDKAGRMGEFGSEAKYAREDDAARGASVGQDLPNGEGTEEGKGKSRWVPAQVMPGSEDRGAMEVVAKGVPYHVPLSAFPVGSTSVTTGGFGYMTRFYGLSVDNIVELEIVLVDGRIMTLNEGSKERSQEEADLWWAVRGAAPCFGIVTRITAKAYPVPSVYSGNLIYPLNPITAPSLIRHWRDCLKAGVPRELYANLIMTAGPDSSSHVIVIQICYLGSKNAGEAIVQAISSWAGERILLKDVEERSFLAQQDGVAKVLKGGAGRRWMIRGDLIGSLTDEVIGETVSRFQALGNRAVWLFELLGGALEDVEPSETCISGSQCQAKFIVAALQQWNDMEEDPRCEKSVDDWMRDIISTVSVGGPFPCFLERSEPLERVRGAFGAENFERLLRLKRQHDPHGIFKHTFANGLTKFVHLLDEPAGAAQSVEVEDATREKGLAHMDADTPLPMLGESIPASAAQE